MVQRATFGIACRERGLWHFQRGIVRALCGAVSKDWHVSTVYQVQTGSVYGFRLRRHRQTRALCWEGIPIRANLTGEPIFKSGTRTASSWMNWAAFAAPAAYTFGNVGRNSVYGPGLQTLDLAFVHPTSI